MAKLDKLIADFSEVIPPEQVEPPAQEYLPTGVLAFDWALGGGYPISRMSMVFGHEGSGKTGLAALAAISAQKARRINGRTLYLDLEHKVNLSLFSLLGATDVEFLATRDPDKPLTGDVALDIVEKAVGAYDLIVIDSMPNLVPAVGFESDPGANAFALVARLCSRRFPILASRLGATKSTVMIINQVRSSMNQYGRDFKPYGGHSSLHSVATISWVRSSKHDAEGFTVTATVDKNSLGPQKRQAEWRIDYTIGIDPVEDAWSAAYSMGLISRSANLEMGDETINLNSEGGRGFTDAKDNIRAHPELLGAIRSAVMGD